MTQKGSSVFNANVYLASNLFVKNEATFDSVARMNNDLLCDGNLILKQNLVFEGSNVLAVDAGGTGVNTLTNEKLLVGNGSNAIETPLGLTWFESKLGINTSAPIEELHVEGNVYISGTIQNAALQAALDNSVGSNMSVPSGTIITSASSNVSIGYIPTDGTAVSRTTYSNLFNAIGVNFGAGDGSTTFNVPNLTDDVYVTTSGENLFTCSSDTEIHKLSPNDLSFISKFTGHTGAVNKLVIGGGFLFSASADSTIRKIDRSTMTEVRIYTGHTGNVTGLVYGSDGFLYSSSINDRTIRKIDPIDMTIVNFFGADRDLRAGIAYGNGLIFYDRNRAVRSLDASTMTFLNSSSLDNISNISSITFGLGFVFVGGLDNSVRRYDTTLSTVTNYLGHTASVLSLRIGGDGYLYSGDAAGELFKLTPTSLGLIDKYTGHAGNSVLSIAWGIDVYSGSGGNNQVHKIDPLSMLQKIVYSGHTNRVNDVVIKVSANSFKKFIKT